jgi:hypothetical protein
MPRRWMNFKAIAHTSSDEALPQETSHQTKLREHVEALNRYVNFPTKNSFQLNWGISIIQYHGFSKNTNKKAWAVQLPKPINYY